MAENKIDFPPQDDTSSQVNGPHPLPPEQWGMSINADKEITPAEHQKHLGELVGELHGTGTAHFDEGVAGLNPQDFTARIKAYQPQPRPIIEDLLPIPPKPVTAEAIPGTPATLEEGHINNRMADIVIPIEPTPISTEESERAQAAANFAHEQRYANERAKFDTQESELANAAIRAVDQRVSEHLRVQKPVDAAAWTGRTGTEKAEGMERFNRSMAWLKDRGVALTERLKSLPGLVWDDVQGFGKGTARVLRNPIRSSKEAGKALLSAAERMKSYLAYFAKSEDSIGEKFKKFGGDLYALGEEYRKLPFQQKLYVSAALLSFSAVTGGAGVFMGLVSGVRFTQRALTGLGTYTLVDAYKEKSLGEKEAATGEARTRLASWKKHGLAVGAGTLAALGVGGIEAAFAGGEEGLSWLHGALSGADVAKPPIPFDINAAGFKPAPDTFGASIRESLKNIGKPGADTMTPVQEMQHMTWTQMHPGQPYPGDAAAAADIQKTLDPGALAHEGTIPAGGAASFIHHGPTIDDLRPDNTPAIGTEHAASAATAPQEAVHHAVHHVVHHPEGISLAERDALETKALNELQLSHPGVISTPEEITAKMNELLAEHAKHAAHVEILNAHRANLGLHPVPKPELAPSQPLAADQVHSAQPAPQPAPAPAPTPSAPAVPPEVVHTPTPPIESTAPSPDLSHVGAQDQAYHGASTAESNVIDTAQSPQSDIAPTVEAPTVPVENIHGTTAPAAQPEAPVAAPAAEVPVQVPHEAIPGLDFAAAHPDEPHLYADVSNKSLTLWGSTPRAQIDWLTKHAAEHPNTVVNGTSLDGKYLIQYPIGPDGTIGVPSQVEDSGFLGFFRSFKSAPDPKTLREAFAKLVE